MKTAVICAGHLGMEFLKALHRHGHQVFAVSSPDARIVAFCNELDIVCEPDQKIFFNDLKKSTFDCLFSIINPKITPDWVLKLPLYGAFNYHDSLLPRHRGVNAVAWALWEGDSDIGFSWHRMLPAVDAGDLLYQEVIPLTGTETVYTANIKVFSSVVRSFDLVLNRFASYADGTILLEPQDYCIPPTLHLKGDVPSRSQRMIDPAIESSVDILRKSRALDFGPRPKIFEALVLCLSSGEVSIHIEPIASNEIPWDLVPGDIREQDESYLFCCADGKVLRGRIHLPLGREPELVRISPAMA